MASIAEINPSATTAVALVFSNERGPLGRFPLVANRVITVGRALECELRFADGLTSRRHAQVAFDGQQVVIEDLESANGTFVNGIKTRRGVLQPGDRVLIGITTIELSVEQGATEQPARSSRPQPAPSTRAHDSETVIVGTARLMSGSVREIPLTDLLQLLANTRKSGVLTVRNQRDTGQIFLRDGRICRATINDSSALQPERTLYRLLRWQNGFFELRPLGSEALQDEIHETADSLVLEAAHQQDEVEQLEKQLPRLDASLTIPESFAREFTDLTPAQFDMLQLVHEHRVLLNAIDAFNGSDLEAYGAILALIENGFVIVE